MAQTTTPVSPAVESCIRRTIAEILAGIPISECSIAADLDHMGEDAISIEVYHPLMDQNFDPQLETDLLVTVHRRLLEMDERRFPYITHHYHEDQHLKG